LTIPSNALSFARHLSKGLAKSAPQLTLEFLQEWAIGFAKSDLPQKTACLLYVGPWISNLNTFAKRSRDNSEESIKQISEIIRSLLSITIAERKVSQSLSRWRDDD
jgi:neurofibromin 1